MSKKSEITVAERQILDFIKFRSNERHRFFGSNEYIGNSIGLQTTSVKNMVNKLVRLEYLTRIMEGKKRYLQYTGKKYEPIVGDLSNYDNAYLKKEVAHYKTEYKDAEQQIELMKIEIEQLKNQANDYMHTCKVLMHLLNQMGMDNETIAKVSSAAHKEIFGY